MIKHCLSTIVLVFVCYSAVYGQYHYFSPDTLTKSVSIVNGEYALSSNALTNQFIGDIYRGGYINTEKKDLGYRLLEKENILGYNYHGEMLHFWKPKKFLTSDSSWLMAGISYHSFNELLFTPEAYYLAFYGNEQWEGDTVDIAPSWYQTSQWQQLKLGYIQHYSSAYCYNTGGFILNINMGLDYTRFNIKKAALYTAPYGESLSLATDYQLMISDTTPVNPMKIKGMGISFDFFYRWTALDQQMSFGVQLLNLGIINWNKKSFYDTKDTVYQYNGFTIDNIFDIEDDPFSGFTSDTVTEQFFNKSNMRRFSTDLPAVLRIDGHFSFLPSLSLDMVVMHAFFTKQCPWVNLRANYHFSERFMVSPSLNYGGYGKYNGGLHLRYDFHNNISLLFGSDYLISMIIPEQLAGTGGYVSLIRKL